ncbi:MAG: PASTA domain-containing protein [Phocaeicola sp.]|nr:PASTA domain-containing protein [Phocaeicola sp.]MBR1597006.1 PASTA domain-containing protein [Phocaeicola sp.]
MVSFKDFFSFKNNRFFWLNIGAMILACFLIILGTLYWLDFYTMHGEAVVVPNVKGKLYNEAEFSITKQKLKVVVIDSSFVKGIKPNTILEQNPDGGMKVKEGRIVYLTINTDKEPMITIPDIVDNSSYRQAEAKLRSLGFKLTAPEMIAGERDWVYGLKFMNRNISAGEKIPSESTLTLQVGNGSSTAEGDSVTNVRSTTQNDPVVDDSWF